MTKEIITSTAPADRPSTTLKPKKKPVSGSDSSGSFMNEPTKAPTPMSAVVAI
jgi:hypothetical protein